MRVSFRQTSLQASETSSSSTVLRKMSDATAFQAYGGEVEIKGGTFQSEPYNGIYYTLNKIDDGTGTITVNAGRFYKYNPAESYTEPNGPVSFVPYDRKVTVDGDWYVVSYGN